MLHKRYTGIQYTVSFLPNATAAITSMEVMAALIISKLIAKF